MFKNQYNRIGGVCQDNDECLHAHILCDERAKCINLPGDYRCECPRGWYQEIDTLCYDFDECDFETHDCHQEWESISMYF